jgi:hypothetical protein
MGYCSKGHRRGEQAPGGAAAIDRVSTSAISGGAGSSRAAAFLDNPQPRSIFDEGHAGMVLIGMPGIEKRIARFPQLYSRIGFVHEFRPLNATEMQELLEQRRTPVGVTLPDEPFTPEVMAR